LLGYGTEAVTVMSICSIATSQTAPALVYVVVPMISPTGAFGGVEGAGVGATYRAIDVEDDEQDDELDGATDATTTEGVGTDTAGTDTAGTDTAGTEGAAADETDCAPLFWIEIAGAGVLEGAGAEYAFDVGTLAAAA
jgi:hypothetical protein